MLGFVGMTRPRPWYQFHLLTLIVVVVTLGFFVLKNCRAVHAPPVWIVGWPLTFYFPFDYAGADPEGGSPYEAIIPLLDAGLALGVAGALAWGCEKLLRREKRGV